MDGFWFSFNAVMPLILIVALGYLLTHLKVFGAPFIDQANKFCFNVAFPISLFSSIVNLDLEIDISWKLYALVIGAILLIVLLLMLIVPRFVKGNPQRGALIQGIYRGNFLLMGYPLARNFFGEAGIGPVVMLLPVVVGLYNFIAVFVLEYYDDSHPRSHIGAIALKIIKNPLIIGALAGTAFTLLRLELPLFISRATEDLGGIASPLALVLLGAQFNWHRVAGNVRLLVAAVVVRMLVIPVLVIAAAILLGFSGPELGGVFILFCAPTAISSYVMAKSMHSDAELAGQIILITTVLSVVTLFAGSYILRYLHLF